MVQDYYIVVLRFSPCPRMVIKEIEDNERWIETIYVRSLIEWSKGTNMIHGKTFDYDTSFLRCPYISLSAKKIHYKLIQK